MSKADDNAQFAGMVQRHLKEKGFYKGDLDEWAGAETQKAFNAFAGIIQPAPNVEAGGNSGAGNTQGGATGPASPGGATNAGVIDERSAKNIATLEVKARPLFERIAIEGTRIAREMGATGYVMISGTRTYAEQDALYEKGRMSPGPKVTNAQAGYSNHNFGIAGDFGVFAGSSYLDSTNAALASKIHKAVAAWVKANLPQIEWGGDWKSFRDEPHYQVKTGLTLAQMRERVAAGRSVMD